MSTEENKALVRRSVEEGWNQGNIAVFDELDTPDFIHHDPAELTVRTREDYKQWVTQSRSAFPDFHLTIEDMIAEGDKVVGRWTMQGTHPGEIVTPMPLPATSKQVTMTGINITRVAGGKIVEDFVSARRVVCLRTLFCVVDGSLFGTSSGGYPG